MAIMGINNLGGHGKQELKISLEVEVINNLSGIGRKGRSRFMSTEEVAPSQERTLRNI